ncbi:Bicarbonate transporter BicA [Anatilimnocola aggregata]|uniref:Bicarbonate transporter BicA n=1 Tax=Anatilimnocola aggregata TaxID=2528021 RepID=A0A517YCM7_9BACT|nr:SulP family inorganic anion transporter [Anatilimnocola aggregata]QDU27981.1 Bicarbonate transporter BicA [Anatilimnocola aggregata]
MPESAPAARPPSFDLRRELLASMVVFLVALPLCIGIAVAVGVSPGRALITGIVGGIVVGLIGGCPLQVSGPAAGLFVIVADALLKQKSYFLAEVNPQGTEADALAYSLSALGVSVMLAGAMQFAAGQFRLGQWFRAVSPAVIEGMLGGIGILILASQFHVMCDHDAMFHGHKAHGGLQYLATIPDALQQAFAGGLSGPKFHATLIGLLSVAAIVLWQSLAPKKLRLIPAALVAVILAVALGVVTGWEVRKLQVTGNILADMSFPSAISLQAILNPGVLLTGGMIAIIASAETLLCATAVDQMQNGPRTNYDQELCAHGIGNFLCGLLGALPMTGVIVRSSANVQAGASSRLSTILHGIWLLVFVVFLPFLLAYIPKAALGAILVYTGFKLVKFKTLQELWRVDKGEALIFLTTMAIIVAEDLLLGVLAGLALSAGKLLYRFSHLAPKLTIAAGQKQATLELEGAATFIRLPLLASFLEQVPVGSELHVDFTHLSYIDHACLELITSWAKRHKSTGGKLVIDWNSLHARFKDLPARSASMTAESAAAVKA